MAEIKRDSKEYFALVEELLHETEQAFNDGRRTSRDVHGNMGELLNLIAEEKERGVTAYGVSLLDTVKAGAALGGGLAILAVTSLAPAVVLGGAVYAVSKKVRQKKVLEEKARLYQEVARKHQAIIRAMKDDLNKSKERQDYLEGLNILLRQALNDLRG